ncbi:hypothetical protein A2U01_0070720, partial [Trifolium medium]|nr:hypothetical protein [Trifolium medium]
CAVFCLLRAAQGVLARCAPLLWTFGFCSVICAPHRRGWRVAPICWKDASGTLGHLRVAQIHTAWRASSSVLHVRHADMVAQRAGAKSI